MGGKESSTLLRGQQEREWWVLLKIKLELQGWKPSQPLHVYICLKLSSEP